MVALLIIGTKRWHGNYSLDTVAGIQKFHLNPTPRVGGLAIIAGVMATLLTSTDSDIDHLWTLLLAGLPAFFLGFVEDLTKKIGVIPRLLGTMVSALLAIWLSGYTLPRVDVWGVDVLMAVPMVTIVFTIFAVGGVANAINIIDGFNGLAISTVIYAFLGYGFMAHQLGDLTIFKLCMTMAVITLGLFLVNWPWGKIFLGDGGAYFLGFSLAWVAVMLIARNPRVSAFAVLSVCAFPVIESLFSIYRRVRSHRSPGQPDRLHFHSVVKRRLVGYWLPHQSITVRNSVTGFLVGLMTLIGCMSANITFEHHLLSVAVFFVYLMGYLSLYAMLCRYKVRRKGAGATVAYVKN